MRKEGAMLQYAVRRLLILPLIMILVSFVLFLLVVQLPVEQRAAIYVPSTRPNITPEQYQALLQATIERYGLDRPFLVQYGFWLRSLVHGGWGYSPTWRQSVLEGLLQRAPATIELTLYAMIPATTLAIGLGTLAARRWRGVPDYLVRAAAYVGWAFPPFILALILVNVFYAWLGWFPPERASLWAGELMNSPAYRPYTRLLTLDALLNGNLRLFWDALRHLVLPAFSLALLEWALLTRIMRSSLLEVLGREYITTARAKGLPEPVVIGRHARRNALLPVISAGGVVTSLLISSIIVVEVIFGINGVGRWAMRAILESDVPVAIGFALFSCTVVVLASLSADLLYAVVDPRIRLQGGAGR
jgi:peptide/nickel transport system permease protein